MMSFRALWGQYWVTGILPRKPICSHKFEFPSVKVSLDLPKNKKEYILKNCLAEKFFLSCSLVIVHIFSP